MIETIALVVGESLLLALAATAFIYASILIYLSVIKNAFANGMLMVKFASVLYFISVFLGWIFYRVYTF
jgi:hypothetical protein